MVMWGFSISPTDGAHCAKWQLKPLANNISVQVYVLIRQRCLVLHKVSVAKIILNSLSTFYSWEQSHNYSSTWQQNVPYESSVFCNRFSLSKQPLSSLTLLCHHVRKHVPWSKCSCFTTIHQVCEVFELLHCSSQLCWLHVSPRSVEVTSLNCDLWVFKPCQAHLIKAFSWKSLLFKWNESFVE